jgi:hypothetical protein
MNLGEGERFKVELMLRGVIRERTRQLGFGLLANELARREPRDLT